MKKEKEIWLPVVGYVGLYEVSNFGNVMSLGNGKSNNSKRRVLSTRENKDGYLIVDLSKKGIQKTLQVHRLVAQAFIPNLFDEPQVNHRDEDKHNNFCGTPENDFNDGNLEWCDGKYNCNHGTRNKRMAEKKSKPLLQLTKTGELVREWSSGREAGRNGFNHGHIVECCLGERKYHHGFIWKYKEVS